MYSYILDKYVEIEQVTNDASIGFAEEKSWSTLKYKWAAIDIKSGGTVYGKEGANVFTRAEILLRYDASINYDCRVVYGINTYNIDHIEPLGRRRFLKIISTDWEGS